MTAVRARQLALAGIVGPAVFAVAAVIGGLLEEGYSPVHSYISELAAEGSSVRVLMTIGFFVLGLSIVLFAWALRALRPAAGVLILLVALSGTATLMAGTFSCDKGCPVKGETSTHQDLHNASAIMTFSPWIIAPFVAARQLRGTRFARVSLLLGVIELAFGLWLGSLGDRQPDDPVGLLQRGLLVAIGVWFVLLALELRTSSADQPPRAATPS